MLMVVDIFGCFIESILARVEIIIIAMTTMILTEAGVGYAILIQIFADGITDATSDTQR